MALTDLLAALETQASERRDAELAAARAEAERIVGDARRVAERERAETLARAHREQAVLAEQAVSSAGREASEAALTARARLLERVYAALEARIARAGDDAGYRASLPREVGESLRRLPPGPVVVRSSAELVDLARAAASRRGDIEVQVAPGLGPGFVVAAPAEGIEIDGTLAARLEHEWPRLAIGVLARVAPGSGAP